MTRVTLLHLTNSMLGVSSSPVRKLRGDAGLSTVGKDFVRRLNAQRIFVDLAHMQRDVDLDSIRRTPAYRKALSDFERVLTEQIEPPLENVLHAPHGT